MPSYKDVAIKAAKLANNLILKYENKRIPGVKVKEGKSLVTDIDLKSESIIIREIKRNFPKHNIISEESVHPTTDSEYTWIIDPIDGTHNFIRGIPMYGISIALAKNDEVILGVLQFPVLKKLYIAQKGKGATCNGKKIKVSDHSTINFSYLHFDTAYSERIRRLQFLKKISKYKHNERMVGCAIYECANVAHGKADGMVLFRINAWDIAAGFLLIEEAGGVVFEKGKKQWTPFGNEYIASNKKIHKKLQSMVNSS